MLTLLLKKWGKIYREEIEKYISWAASEAEYKIRHEIIADIGVEELEKIVQKGKENREKIGHSDYTNLAKLYGESAGKYYDKEISERDKKIMELKEKLAENHEP